MNAKNNSVVRKRMKVYYGDFNKVGQYLLPLIRIRGKHLLKYGFQVGATISVVISNGEIIIKKIPQENSSNRSGV